MPEVWFVAIATWLCSGVVGAIIGARRNSLGPGFLLGLLFGPLGAIAAFALDGRPMCPTCRNRIDLLAQMCPICRTELAWLDGTVGTKEQVGRWRARKRDEALTELFLQKERDAERAESQQEFNRKVQAVAVRLWDALLHGFRFAVISPLTTIDGWLRGVADGSRAIYRMLVLFWFGLIPLVVGCSILIISCRSKPSSLLGIPAPIQLHVADERPEAVAAEEAEDAHPVDPPPRIRVVAEEPALPARDDIVVAEKEPPVHPAERVEKQPALPRVGDADKENGPRGDGDLNVLPEQPRPVAQPMDAVSRRA